MLAVGIKTLMIEPIGPGGEQRIAAKRGLLFKFGEILTEST